LVVPEEFDRSSHVYHQYTLITQDVDRDGLLQHLLSKDIPCAVYYPVPLHMQKAYLDPRYKEGDFPVTEMLARQVISLPIHTEMEEDQLDYITATLLEFINSH
jgi:UDP-2-acetamido-2-deoxy-ribo-hexuluronate aminotransferase